MLVEELEESEKLIIKKICQSYPEKLKEYLKVEHIADIKEIQKETSREFLRFKKTGHNVDDFYKQCKTYLPELVLYAANPGRIQSVCKRLRILKRLGINKLVDYGCGVGIDSVVYAKFGIKCICVEFENQSRKFAEYVVDNDEDALDKVVFISPDSFLKFDDSYQAIQAIEVVAHLENPYKVFENLMSRCKVFIWTNDIHVHRDDAENDPQHLEHSYSKVCKSLEEAGGHKVKFNHMAIPPLVYMRK